MGSERAGQRAAAIQSLLATASLNGLEPYASLRSTLDKLPVWPHSRIDELLPLGSRVIDVDATPKDVIDTRIIPRRSLQGGPVGRLRFAGGLRGSS